MANTSPISAFDAEENIEVKALEIMREYYPSIDCGPGTPVYEMVIRPIAYLWSRQSMGLEELIKSVSFNDYVNMATEDLDRLMNRYFLTRRVGKNTTGIVRCITKGNVDIYIMSGEIWEIEDGRTYEVQTTIDIKKDEWDDMKDNGDPLYWYTELTNVVTAKGRLATIAELYALVGMKIGDKYIVTSTDSVWEYKDVSNEYIWVEDKSITHPILYKEVPDDKRVYYIDTLVVSTGTGSIYNAAQYDTLIPTGTSSADIVSAYFLHSTNDGGASESNYDFYTRAKNELAFRGMCSYKSTSSLLLENFDTIKEVVSIGLKDTEMIRDLVQISTGSSTTPITIHSGGRCDIYIKPTQYYAENGYNAPLGFPLMYEGINLKDDIQDALMTKWNTEVAPRLTYQIGLRGSLRESVGDYLNSKTNMTNLKSDLDDITEFVENGENTPLHTDSLVKQMWPIIIKVNLEIESDNPEEDILLAKMTVNEYIKSLKSSEAPQIAELAHVLRSAGIKSVHVPSTYKYPPKTSVDLERPILKAYYIRDSFDMEWFGLNGTTSSTSTKPTLLKPVETDSLKFEIREDYANQSQITLRTCTWYTNMDLINIEVSG